MARIWTMAAAATALLAASPALADPAPAAPAPTPPASSYNVRDYTDDTGSEGNTTGTHSVSGHAGHISTIVVGGADPSVEVTGTIPAGTTGYLYGGASYKYSLSIGALNSDAANKLTQVATTGNGDEIVGHLSGYLRVNANYSSLAQVGMAAFNPVNGAYGSSIGGGCGGYLCSPIIVRDTLTPVTLNVPKYVFDFGCARNDAGAIIGGCSGGTTLVSLLAFASLRSDPGYGGLVEAYLDPVFTFDPAFLSNHGFGANSLGFTQNSLGTVPEPATWTMLILGFGVVGGAMRRRRRNAAAGTAFA